MKVRRLDPATGFTDILKGIEQRASTQETREAGNIVIRQTLTTADPTTGVSAVFGQLPDGSVGFQPFVGDTTPPPVPTTPHAVTQSGTVILTWDGQFAASAVAPKDFQFVRVYARQTTIQTTSFPASGISGTDILLGSLKTPNDSLIVGSNVVTTGLSYIFYATSVDYNLNESYTSPSTTGVVIASVLEDPALLAQLNTIQATANGKNTSTYSSAAASGSGTRAGDIWFQTNTSNIIIGQWQWSGTAWVPQTIDNAVVANIDAGKISTGYLSAARLQTGSIMASSGIIADINADTITSGTMNAIHVAIGSGTNALSDPGFNSTPLTNARTAQSTGGTGGWAVSNGTSTGLRKAVRTTASTSDVFSYLTLPHTYANAGQLIPCVAGQVWTLKVDTQTSSSTAGVTFQAYTASADGTVATTAITSTSIATTAQRSVTATYTIPAGVTGFSVGLKCDTTAITWTVYGNAFIGQQVTGDLIVNGAIDGKTITGALIQTASSGARITMDSSSLNAYNSSGGQYFTLSSGSLAVTGQLASTGTTDETTPRPMSTRIGKVITNPGGSGAPTNYPAIWFDADYTHPYASWSPPMINSHTGAELQLKSGMDSTNKFAQVTLGGSGTGYTGIGNAQIYGTDNVYVTTNTGGNVYIGDLNCNSTINGNSITISGTTAGSVSIDGVSMKVKRAEYFANSWGVTGGANWDTGPVTLDTTSTLTVNNTFSSVGGVNGSINISETGYYMISLKTTCSADPGNSYLQVNRSSGENLMNVNNLGTAHWECYGTTVPVYLVAGEYIRSLYHATNNHAVSSRWKIVKVNF